MNYKNSVQPNKWFKIALFYINFIQHFLPTFISLQTTFIDFQYAFNFFFNQKLDLKHQSLWNVIAQMLTSGFLYPVVCISKLGTKLRRIGVTTRLKASSTRSSPKPSCSLVIKLVDLTRETWPRGESWVK